MRYLRTAAILVVFATAGCGLVLHPIDKADFWKVKKGDKIVHADGSEEPITKDGWVMSDDYMKLVIQAKVKSRK